MMVFIVLLAIAAVCAGLAYWIDARRQTKVYGGIVIALWLAVFACAALMLAWVFIVVAVWTGHLYTGALR